MGNREDLLAGAKRCLYEKGYMRTTARDIATASGTSLASIGYHFRSTKALLNAALFQAMEEWGDELERALAADTDPDAGPMERFEAVWARVIESFATHRALWATQLEMATQIQHLPELREQLAEGQMHGRIGLAQLFQDIDPSVDEQKARMVGSFYQALLSGMLLQWLIDPERAPSAHDLADALRAITSHFGNAGNPETVAAAKHS